MKLRPICLATLALISLLSQNASAQEQRRTYIIQLASEPATTYAGGVSGLDATAAAPGTRYNGHTAAALAYTGYLENNQAAVAALTPNAPMLASYTTVLNGYAASLTDAEVLTLRASPQVIDIQLDEARTLNTVTTSAKFLELDKPGGLWSQLVGGRLNKGEDIIIGIVDGGIWPENPAFADRLVGGVPSHDPAGTLAYTTVQAWNGSCVTGTGFTPALHCNNKLIGARYFNAGFNANQPALHWTDFANSPRDSVGGATGHGGHGTHTASTAGGNSNNPVVMNGVPMGFASGVAPRARIAAYKVCWTFPNPAATDGTGSQNTCYNTDAVAAIDRAVQDGVHVINYSISGSQTSVNDAVEQAFLRAARAGVFVATSAGNSGPANAVAHVSPWLTTVAASTHGRFNQADVTLGNSAKYSGASLNLSALPATPMILSTAAKTAAASTADANLCFLNTLDPAKVAGKVVVCTRGTNARTEKSLVVKNAGGVGMVLADNGVGLVVEVHSVPTVHVSSADGDAIKLYAATPGATAAIGTFYPGALPAPIMADFSSRGPNQGDSNILKPDLAAPGVDVIAGVTAPLSQANRDAVANGTLVPPATFESYQGTSMASPHVAGMGALLRQAHPTWSPAAIKSALMTTTITTLNDGQPGMANGLLPWAQGTGNAVPNKATDPGLVYDAGAIEWTRFQCKVNKAAVAPASDCTTYGTLDETYNLNMASITAGAVALPVSITRKVTNVGASEASYNASFVAPAGFTMTVTPSSLALAPGASASFVTKLTVSGAALGVWNYGSLTWSDGSHTVRIPVTARAGTAITAASQLTATSNSGSRIVVLKTAFTGRPSANKGGLKDATMSAQASLAPAGMTSAALKTACIAGADKPNMKVYTFNVPAGALLIRAALRQSDVGDAGDDNDLILVAPSGVSVYSGNDGSGESAQMLSPAAGQYKVCVLAFGGLPVMTHKLSSWVVTQADIGGKLTVLLPGNVVTGGSASAGVSWSGLANGGRFAGGIEWKDASGVVHASTGLYIETNGGLPLADPSRDLSPRQLEKLAD